MNLTGNCTASHVVVIAFAFMVMVIIKAFAPGFFHGASDANLVILKVATTPGKYALLFWLIILIISANILNNFGIVYAVMPPECK